MSQDTKRVWMPLFLLIIITFVGAIGFAARNHQVKGSRSQSRVRVAAVPKTKMRRPINYRQSSETKPYPRHLDAKQNRIVVSLKNQRAYLLKGHKVIYEFYVSTGRNQRGYRTPTGRYQINGHRERWFYDSSEHEGARDAVGWHDGGVYLFHETPSNRHGKIIKSAARQLGKHGSSYGCVHLSIPDAKWLYSHAPKGMPVIINRN